MAGSRWQIRKPNATGIPGIISQEMPDSEKKRSVIRKKMKDFWKKTVELTIPDNGLRRRTIVKPADPS